MDPSPARMVLAAVVFVLPLAAAGVWSRGRRGHAPARTLGAVRRAPDESWRGFWRMWLVLGAMGTIWWGTALGVLLGDFGQALLLSLLGAAALIGYAALLRLFRLESTSD